MCMLGVVAFLDQFRAAVNGLGMRSARVLASHQALRMRLFALQSWTVLVDPSCTQLNCLLIACNHITIVLIYVIACFMLISLQEPQFCWLFFLWAEVLQLLPLVC